MMPGTYCGVPCMDALVFTEHEILAGCTPFITTFILDSVRLALKALESQATAGAPGGLNFMHVWSQLSPFCPKRHCKLVIALLQGQSRW